MKTIDYLKNLRPGEVVNKRGLYAMKRAGLIWDYSQWGYLESLIINGARESDGFHFCEHRDFFPKGNASVMEQYDGAMYGKWRQGSARTEMTGDQVHELIGWESFAITYQGMRFEKKYFDGCFSPYLIKA